jgi:hypothetical protein
MRKHRANDREEDHNRRRIRMSLPRAVQRRPALFCLREKKLVAALERFHGYKSDANRKKTKRYEVNKHKRAEV